MGSAVTREGPLIRSSVQPCTERRLPPGNFPLRPTVRRLRGPECLAVAALLCGLFILLSGAALGQQQSSPPSNAADASDTPANSPLPGVKDYLNASGEPIEISSLGVTTRDGQARLEDGKTVAGAEVVEVSPNGPAARALGTHEVSHALVSGAVLGAGVASAVLFPPALIAVAMAANSHIGMSYDLVVGVDGNRVRNTMDFMQTVAEAHSGDTIYLAIVRSGRRVQVPLHLQ